MVATDPKAGRKFIYRFQEGNAGMRDLLGGKGANLCEMASLGLPVPPGFVITTATCRAYHENGARVPDGLWDDARNHLREVEQAIGKGFGDPKNPLLVSVRSGAKMSMPGMMDTILNLGLNDETTEGFAKLTDDRRFALDSYRRFIQLFSKVALRIDSDPFEKLLHEVKERTGAASDADLGVEALEEIVEAVQGDRRTTAPTCPSRSDPWDQLRMAVQAVFQSWNSERAVAYRDYHGIPHDLYTAANVMAMVFGNSGWDSGTGVCFTRNPSTGEPLLYGEYLANAQGEDVVSGARTPKPIAALADEMPKMYEELVSIARKLEQHYRDAQDIEFTVEHGKLYMLQTRAAKRNAAAAVRMAVEMAHEGLITKEEGLLRVPADDLSQLLLPRFDEASKQKAIEEGRLLGSGLNASPGAATGRAVFESGAVAAAVESGPVILVRPETSPDDMPGILRAAAVLTSRGGITSHAAVVTRGLGKPAVVGASDLRVEPEQGRVSANGASVSAGEEISIDGFTGEVFSGHIDTVPPDVNSNAFLTELLTWANETKRLGVRANADTPHDAGVALGFGAQGIGLCRTEHMFFDSDKDNPQRFPWVQDMLMHADAYYTAQKEVAEARSTEESANNDAKAEAQRRLREAEDRLEEARPYLTALARLEEYQTADFEGILRAMDGKPVVIRLLDPPLHEFLPPLETLIEEVAVLRATGGDEKTLAEKEHLLSVARRLHEQNPMMGHRGCRLGVTYPDVYEMQVRAIVRAAINLRKEGLNPHPEIMIPLVMDVAELKSLKGRLLAVAQEFEREAGRAIPFGTMIELPRAALTAGDIAPEVSFFSFGSNDLTQMTFGFSRDDAEEKFLGFYVEHGILPGTPFRTIDEKGVGRLIQMAAEEGRAANPRVELGICGEHGGDPESIEFCHRAGLTYVSCSPMRIPTARLAAAQAALERAERDV